MHDLQDLFDVVMGILVPSLVVIIPILVQGLMAKGAQLWDDIQMSDPTRISEFLEKAAEFAVNVAEQLWETDQIMSDERKQKALDAIQNYTSAHGYDVDLELLDNAIEATIRRLKNKDTL